MNAFSILLRGYLRNQWCRMLRKVDICLREGEKVIDVDGQAFFNSFC